MIRVETLAELEIRLSANPSSCLARFIAANQAGSRAATDLIAARTDFLKGLVRYYFDDDGSYIRTFKYDNQEVVDFGRPAWHITQNARELQKEQGSPLWLPAKVAHRTLYTPRALIGTEALPKREVHFIFDHRHPTYRIGFPESGEHTVAVIE